MYDAAAERAVLAGIFRHGNEVYVDVSDILTAKTFFDDSNQIIYRCLEHVLKDNPSAVPDLPSVLSAAAGFGLKTFDSQDERKLLRAVMAMPVEKGSVRRLAAKVRKLEVGRLLVEQLDIAKNRVSEITGEETIDHILGLAENPIFDFTTLLANSNSDAPKEIAEGLEEYVQHLADNPVDIVGISTGLAQYDRSIGGGLRRKTVNLVGARPKALRYGSKVYTKTGPINIELTRVGDEICHPSYGFTEILEVFDFYTDIYRLHFRDGDYVDCCKDHRWEVYKRYPYGPLANKQSLVKTTHELINDLYVGGDDSQEYKWDIRLPKPVTFQSQEVPLDPYVLGSLIGDGSFGNAITFTCADVDIESIEYITSALSSYDIKLDSVGSGCKSYRINGLQPIIRQLDLFKSRAYHKFIPDLYKYNSIEIRLGILRGLMDTDGDCTTDKRSGNTRCRFGTVSLQLANDVKELVMSLGGLCSVNVAMTKYKGKPHKSYRCEIRLPLYNPFRLKRKADKVAPRIIGDLKRTIVKIEKIGVDNARCLRVAADDGLFLTNNCIITHNSGKSHMANNVAIHVAEKLGIPALYLDSEMSQEDQRHRTLANLSEVEIDEIETGRFGKNDFKRQKVMQAVSKLKGMPYYYKSIAGQPFEETLAVMRRWVLKSVGLQENGEAKPCVIIFDYLKLMSSEGMSAQNIAEFQMLGFMMTGLHNFMVKYSVPCLCFIQLNRDGITREDTDVASGSDRLIWLCSNFTLFKKKSDEEMAEEIGSKVKYNRKLVPIVARHGAGLDDGDYINIQARYEIGQIIEGPTRNNLGKQTASQDKGFVVNTDDEEIPFNAA